MALLGEALGRIKMEVTGVDLFHLHGERVIIVSDCHRMSDIRS